VGYSIRFTGGELPLEEFRDSVAEILGASRLFALATVGPEEEAHANTAFFAADETLTLYFVSERTTQHSRNLAAHPRAAVNVFLEPPRYGEQLRGLQLSGRVQECEGGDLDHALEVYQRRFPDFAQDPEVRERFRTGVAPSALYSFQVESLTLLDEPRFGRRNYVSAAVTR
jgi:uncharacterized protein YhbP (UPF0306 family)